MEAPKYNKSGKSSGNVELPADVFEGEYSRSAIYNVIRAELANRRQGTHKTKERAEVRGGGKKPWRQKGTGNARQGSIRAAQWKGGGTVFGPRVRSHRVELPVQVRRAGIRAILQSKAARGAVAVLEDLSLDSFSTKAVSEVFKTMGFIPGGTVAFVVGEADEKLLRSTQNIPFIRLIHASRITAPELYYSSQVIIAESALSTLESLYKKSRKAEVA